MQKSSVYKSALLVIGYLVVMLFFLSLQLKSFVAHNVENMIYATDILIVQNGGKNGSIYTGIEDLGNALLQNGLIQSVVIKNEKSRALFMDSLPTSPQNRPSWFAKMLSRPDIVLERSYQVPFGQKIYTVETQLNIDRLYLQTQTFIRQFFFFLVFPTLILIAAFYYWVKRRLQPVSALIAWSKKYLNKEAGDIEKIDFPVSLEPVRKSINQMVRREAELIKRNDQISKELWRLSYIDEKSGVYQRKYLFLKLSEYLLAEDKRSQGTFFLVSVQGFVAANRRAGYEKMDAYLSNLGELLVSWIKERRLSIVVKMNGSEFAVIVPGNLSRTSVTAMSEELMQQIFVLSDHFGFNQMLSFGLGVCSYYPGEKISDILMSADSALASALQSGKNAIQINDETNVSRSIYSKHQWNQILEYLKHQEYMRLESKNCYHLASKRPYCVKLTPRIIYQNDTLDFNTYAPYIDLFGFHESYFELLTNIYRAQRQESNNLPIVLHLLAESFHESEMIIHFENFTRELHAKKESVIFEFEEYGLMELKDIILERLDAICQSNGQKMAVSNFGSAFGETRIFQYLLPEYVKVNASVFRSMNRVLRGELHRTMNEHGIRFIIDEIEEEETLGWFEKMEHQNLYGCGKAIEARVSAG